MVDTVSQNGALPPITYLDMEKIKREHSYNHSAITSALHMPAPPLMSPSIYSGPPPPYSYPSSAASSVVGGGGSGPGIVGVGVGVVLGAGNHFPQTENRRASGDEKDHLPASQRLSLPSISEALTGEQQQPISISSLLSSSTPQPKFSLAPKSPTSPVGRSYLETVPKGPPDSFPQHTSSSYRPPQPSDRSSGPNYSPRTATSLGESRFPAMPAFDSHQPVPPPPRTISSPSHYSRPGASPIQSQQSYVPPSPMHEKTSRAAHAPPESNTPFGYGVNTYQPAYSYPQSTPGVSSYRTPALPPSGWRGTAPEIERVDEIRKATAKETSPPRPAYGESVKRHLDIFDLETSLNEIAEGSGRGLEFSRHFGTRAHQTQRSGPIPGSLPSLAECDEMIRQQTKVLNAMSRIRDVICKQQQALVEQRNYDQQNYKSAPSEADDNEYMDKLEGSGGFAGADAKKRRGKAAPPGRCHSCNRAETPEWRRGPDGARTLCNACGLHYAKLTRKMGPKASTSIGPSNLRPKESSPHSP